MNWSFIIVSNPTSEYDLSNLYKVIQSIRELKIPTYEILLIGPFDSSYNDGILRVIEFDENIKKGWITKKKNLGAQQSKYTNLCILHDYVSFDKSWYTGYLQFTENWETCCNKILNPNNQRHSDWTISTYDVGRLKPELFFKMWDLNLPYETLGLTKIQYYSGNYFCVKKQFMLENPLNEKLVINDAEDIEWSERIRQKTEFNFNINSTNHILKENKWAPGLIDEELLRELKDANNIK